MSKPHILSTEFKFIDSALYVTITFFSFVLYGHLCTFILSKFEFLRTHSNFWRFKNTFISWSHALLASVFVITK